MKYLCMQASLCTSQKRQSIFQHSDLHILTCVFWYCTGAELANVMNEAALEAVRRNGSVITSIDIYNAMDRILQVRKHHACRGGYSLVSASLGYICI